MADGKLLEVDKDEWFFHSMKKYSDLYMFELEFPLDTLEVINETSLCVSGVQAYSKTCELLQLCVPPKLLRHESDEGLCKDRDFKILSGGYAEGRIRQVKFIKSSTNLVAAYQDGFSGIIMYEVGDDNRATIVEKCRLPTTNSVVAKGKSLCVTTDRILLGATSAETSSIGQQNSGIVLTEWKLDGKCDLPAIANTRYIWKAGGNPGHIAKMKQWEQDTCIFITSRGVVALYDLRTGEETPNIFFNATKSPNIVPNDCQVSSPDSVIFSFDCIPPRYQISVIDSCGGYETYDARFIGNKGANDDSDGSTLKPESRNNSRSRSLLPEFSNLSGVYPDSFNIEFEEERTKVRENEKVRFLISGLKKECVPVLEESFGNTADTTTINSVFSHDGHSKPVTHATWHPASSNLIFSASVDAVLHAWQFIPENN